MTDSTPPAPPGELRELLEAIQGEAAAFSEEHDGCDRIRRLVSLALEKVPASSLPRRAEPFSPDHRCPEIGADTLHGAFVAGAKWWEWKSTGGTMWASDRDQAWAEAEKRYGTTTALLTTPSQLPGEEWCEHCGQASQAEEIAVLKAQVGALTQERNVLAQRNATQALTIHNKREAWWAERQRAEQAEASLTRLQGEHAALIAERDEAARRAGKAEAEIAALKVIRELDESELTALRHARDEAIAERDVLAADKRRLQIARIGDTEKIGMWMCRTEKAESQLITLAASERQLREALVESDDQLAVAMGWFRDDSTYTDGNPIYEAFKEARRHTKAALASPAAAGPDALGKDDHAEP